MGKTSCESLFVPSLAVVSLSVPFDTSILFLVPRILIRLLKVPLIYVSIKIPLAKSLEVEEYMREVWESRSLTWIILFLQEVGLKESTNGEMLNVDRV